MKTIFLVIVCFLLGVSGVAGFRYFQVIHAAPFTPQPSTFTFEPPAQAVSGMLTITRGKAEKFSRTADEYEEASSGAKILTGESVATKKLSQATAIISGIVDITFNSDSELTFTNLFPENMVLQQKAGKIQYDVSHSTPVAIRALHALISVTSGSTTITIIDTDMSVQVTTGTAKLALVDTDNNTHVWELTDGERANIDDAAREVRILSR